MYRFHTHFDRRLPIFDSIKPTSIRHSSFDKQESLTTKFIKLIQNLVSFCAHFNQCICELLLILLWTVTIERKNIVIRWVKSFRFRPKGEQSYANQEIKHLLVTSFSKHLRKMPLTIFSGNELLSSYSKRS